MLQNKNKKLVLNPRTIRALATNEMKAVVGGFAMNMGQTQMGSSIPMTSISCMVSIAPKAF